MTPRTLMPVFIVLALSAAAPAIGAAQELAEGADRLVDTVRVFADNVLERGRDTYGPEHTPLLVDGINVDTGEPATWVLDGNRWVMSNLASQQNLLRVFVGLSNLTGDLKYRETAEAIVRYAFAHLQHEEGLLDWGGHRFYDAAGDRAEGEGVNHELKWHYPYYELMWEIDPEATRRFIEEFWNAHILDWSMLDMNRHGGLAKPRGALWDSEYVGGPVPFVGRGLTFINTGSDLFYSAALLSKLNGDPRPMAWAKRMARRYVETRNPKTGLGGYQYSRIKDDRAWVQFGPEFGERLLECTMLDQGRATGKFAKTGLCQLLLSEVLGVEGEDFLRWAHEGLTAYGKHAYDAEDNRFWPMISDGTRLSPSDVKRKGYYAPEGLEKFEAEPRFLLAYAVAFRLTGDPFMWRMVRDIARGHDLGEVGERPGDAGAVAGATSCADPHALLSLLELHRATAKPEFLAAAELVGENLIAAQFHHGFFLETKDHLYAKFDSPTPLALLHLAAAKRRRPDLVPTYWGGAPYFTCTYDGKGRTHDTAVIYSLTRQ